MMKQTLDGSAFAQLQTKAEISAAGTSSSETAMSAFSAWSLAQNSVKKEFGKKLTFFSLAYARLKGAEKSYLKVIRGNKAAGKLYAKAGYAESYGYWYRRKRLCRERIISQRIEEYLLSARTTDVSICLRGTCQYFSRRQVFSSSLTRENPCF